MDDPFNQPDGPIEPSATVTQLPENVDFDLDAWSPDPKDIKEPFRSRIAGRVVVFNDPRDKPWQELVNLSSPVQFIRVCCNKEDREFLLNHEMDSRKLEALLERFMTHFDVDEAIAAAQRQDQLRRMS